MILLLFLWQLTQFSQKTALDANISAKSTWFNLSHVCWQVLLPGADIIQYSETFILTTKTTIHYTVLFCPETNYLSRKILFHSSRSTKPISNFSILNLFCHLSAEFYVIAHVMPTNERYILSTISKQYLLLLVYVECYISGIISLFNAFQEYQTLGFVINAHLITNEEEVFVVFIKRI